MVRTDFNMEFIINKKSEKYTQRKQSKIFTIKNILLNYMINTLTKIIGV